MRLDGHYEPVVIGQTLLVPSSRSDGLTAYDTRSGSRRWHFFADGPVRYPAAAAEGRACFASDDGSLYCVDVDTGALLWKFSGAPRDRRLLGNGRLIATWPARGAPVIADGTVYFACGIWPFMGVGIYALDLRTGQPTFANEADGSIYIQQPHNAGAFGGIAPQGPLVVNGTRLLIPGGRSVPACYDRSSGNLLHFELARNPRRGGAEVASFGDFYFCDAAAFDAATGSFVGSVGRSLVATPGRLWYAGSHRGLLSTKFPSAGSRSPWKPVPDVAIDTPRLECVILAGERVYVGSSKRITAYEKEKEVWTAEIDGTPATLLAADDRLFVATREGQLFCFGAEKTDPRLHPWQAAELPAEESPEASLLKDVDGLIILWSGARAGLIQKLRSRSNVHVLAFDPDPLRVESLRRGTAEAGVYGDRFSANVGDPLRVPLAPYLASAMYHPGPVNAEILARLFASTRPFGGRIVLRMDPARRGELERMLAAAGLADAEVVERFGFLEVERPGGIPGADDWTHEHANAAQTRASKDAVVRPPLGLLWFGSPAHDDALPRHGHGPQPQVAGGRVILMGVDGVSASDIYTGRPLWRTPLKGAGDAFNNLAHQPGANGRGANLVSLSDGIYVAHEGSCLRLDPVSGRVLMKTDLPGKAAWGYLNVADDVLIGGAAIVRNFPVQRTLQGGFDDPLAPPNPTLRPPFSDDDSGTSSRELFVFNRHSGELKWRTAARAAFRHNAMCAGNGRLFAIDRAAAPREARENSAAVASLAAFDLSDGRELWRSETGVFGTWLAYSERRNILIETGNGARDTLSDEAPGMKARSGADGRVLWTRDRTGPAMIRGDAVILSDGALDLLTGAPIGRTNPLTEKREAWTWTRSYGCGQPAAADAIMTFRSGAAGYYDLARDGGTGNFGGFRSGCTNNLIPAGGVLSSPDYTRTCECSYQNQAALALVPMADSEQWTVQSSGSLDEAIRRIGVNLGAPGDRRAEDGTLWLEHPYQGGPSPAVPLTTTPETPVTFRKNPLRVSGEGVPWIAASGMKGLRKLVLTVDPMADRERLYTVRLHFVEPDGLNAGRRIFDVALQGRLVLTGFDISKEAGGPDRALVREFPHVSVRRELSVELREREAHPVLCGLELVPELPQPWFRAALEQQVPESYRLVVLRTGDADLRALRESAANVRVSVVNTAQSSSPARAALAYPDGSKPLIWRGPLEEVENLLNSPLRTELTNRLRTGTAPVFLLLECGDRVKDDEAARLLETTLAEIKDVAFSFLRLSRDDPKEEILRRMLLKSEPGLTAAAAPLVFAVYGRGRTLPGVPVARAAIEHCVARLLTKVDLRGRSEGFDLLLSADWSAALGRPDTTSWFPLQETPEPVPPPAPRGRRTLWIGAALFLTAVAAVRIRRQRSRVA